MLGGMLTDDAKLDMLIALDRRRWRRQLLSTTRDLERALRALPLPQAQQTAVQDALDAHIGVIWAIASGR